VSYEVIVTPSAQRDFDRLPDQMHSRVSDRLRSVAKEPRPPGARRVQDMPAGNYRLRVGDCRIGYAVDDKARTVRVWQIADRKRFYQQMKRRRV